MTPSFTFDLALRLEIICDLMYRQTVLSPAFDLAEFARERGLDLDAVGSSPIPAVIEYFESIELTPELLAEVEDLSLEFGTPSSDILDQVWPGQDEGDDGDELRLESLRGVERCINLRRFELTDLLPGYDEVDISPLVELPQLQTVELDDVLREQPAWAALVDRGVVESDDDDLD